MNDTIKLILSLSMSGSIIAILIFALKPLIKYKLSQSIQYYIWLIVLFRLVIPFSFEGSVMNNIFYKDAASKDIINQAYIKPETETVSNTVSSLKIPNVKQNVANGVYDGDVNHSRYLIDLLNQYVLYLWLIGLIIALGFNLIGYARFLKLLKKGNSPADEMQNNILAQLLNGQQGVKLVRNRYITTPMLIGFKRPCIVIPDADFSETQIKNILLHETVHLKRFDIAIKWLTLIATSVHWFNPLMYFIKKEINNACELACDEAVIKNLSASEKQAYGDTLISVVSEHEYPVGALQATMCEEKKSLKERLISIMKYNKKSKFIVIISIIMLVSAVAGAVALGASVGVDSINPPKIYIAAENMKTKEALTGTYSWGRIQSDSLHPFEFDYSSDNVVALDANEQMIISTQKIKLDKRYNFKLEKLSVHKNGQQGEAKASEQGDVEDSLNKQIDGPEPYIFNDNNLYLQAPSDSGEYIYSITLNYGKKGTVNYGFVVRVGMVNYDLTEISKFRTPYVGNNSKVLGIVGNLPVPDKRFNQRFISLETDKQPYGLNVFYEVKSGNFASEWTEVISSKEMYANLEKNALVLFCMIDNLDVVKFAFRNSQSDGKLDSSEYEIPFSFERSSIKEKYGDISLLGKDFNLLQEALEGKTSNSVNDDFTSEEIESAREVVSEYFRAVKAKDDKAILKTLTPRLSNPKTTLYGSEIKTLMSIDYNPDDPMRESYISIGKGRTSGTKKENVIVFRVNFNIDYPVGSEGAFKGDYIDWSMTLVRKDKSSPWLIDGQGV